MKVNAMFRPVLSGLLLLVVMVLSACSTTPSNVRTLLNDEDIARVSGTSLAIFGDQIQTSSQGDTRIFTLHHQPDDIVQLSETVARAFGFLLTEKNLADYHLRILRATPDGGACVEGWSAAGEGASYTASVLTLGILPARGAQCLLVSAELFAVIAGTPQLLAEFESNDGQVTIVAGARDVDRYRSSVDRADELRALEASIGALFQTMIRQGAFD